jgi:O-antigen/teichoic acid export membrane protein
MFASLYVQRDRAELQKLVSLVTQASFWPAFATALLLVLFSTPILGLFGAEFVAARWELAILALGQLINIGAGPVLVLMNMTGHQDASLRVFGWSAFANVILNASGIHFFGVMGAALASVLTMVLWNTWLHQLVVRELGVHPSILAALPFRARAKGGTP